MTTIGGPLKTPLTACLTAADDQAQATRVVVRDLMSLPAYPADKLDAEEQANAKARFDLVVKARMHERRLERITLDRVIIEQGGKCRAWTGSLRALVHEQIVQTRQLVDALVSLKCSWVQRPDGMYVRLPGRTYQIDRLTELLAGK